jgi:hypothetical protein
VRVQPYGGPDFDFLDVERRRTLKASTAYYSFRNIMGAVELTSRNNPNLVEKAGREGFREDKAYRQFRSILINFFIQSAADFFRENGGKYSEEWVEKRQELHHLDKVRKAREKQSKEKKDKFGVQLEKFFNAVDSGQFPLAVSATFAEFERDVQSELQSNKPPQQKALAIGRLEAEAKLQLDKLRKSHLISKPRGVGLNTELRNNWQAYQSEIGRITNDLVAPTERQIEEIITSTVKANNLNLGSGPINILDVVRP